MKTIVVLLILCFVIMVVGCSESNESKGTSDRIKLYQKAVDICVEAGGMPVTSWYDDYKIVDCIIVGGSLKK